jgi:hypothetical protein
MSFILLSVSIIHFLLPLVLKKENRVGICGSPSSIISHDSASSTSAAQTNRNSNPATNSAYMLSDQDTDVFKLLMKQKIVTLSNIDEEFQIPFAWAPVDQAQACVIVALLGSAR